MANTQSPQNPSCLRLVGGTEFVSDDQPIIRQLGAPVGEHHAARIGEVKGAKGVLDVLSMEGGWVILDGCVPTEVAIALLNTYAELRVRA